MAAGHAPILHVEGHTESVGGTRWGPTTESVCTARICNSAIWHLKDMATTLWGEGERERERTLLHIHCVNSSFTILSLTHTSTIHVHVSVHACIFYLYLSLELLESLLEQVLAFPALLVEINLFG